MQLLGKEGDNQGSLMGYLVICPLKQAFDSWQLPGLVPEVSLARLFANDLPLLPSQD